jgi:predicted membrane chloride channel (bestrophin family)
MPPDPFANSRAGEGTLLMSQTRGGYWMRTLFALRGRPAPPVPLMSFYALYITGATCLSMLGTEESRRTGTHMWIVLDINVILVGSAALSFLLVFRTNSSYDRWWEGRRIFGSIMNRSRNLARQAIAFVDDAGLVEQLIRYTAAERAISKGHMFIFPWTTAVFFTVDPVKIGCLWSLVYEQRYYNNLSI